MKEKSIAVLPFLNMSADPENEYFSDGITEEIINALTTIKGLNVTARTSSFVFKNKNTDVREIGAQLGVSVILEGSVRRDKNKIRITAQLIDTETGFHIWAKNFDREIRDIFALQDEISLLIADQIRENFGHLELEDHLINFPEIPIETYELYLKGKHYLYTLNKNNIYKGISLLEKVTELQPDFASAFANVHYGYNMLAATGLMRTEQALEKGINYLRRAMELNSNLPECYHSLGWHSLNRDWDFINARKYLTKALDLSPAYADAHQKLFITLALEGKLEAAFKHISTALKLDPLSPLNHYFKGYYFYLKKQYREAITTINKCHELSPNFLFAYSIKSLALIAQGNANAVLDMATLVPDIEGADTEKLIMKTLAYSSLNDVANATPGLIKLQNTLKEDEGERARYFLIHIKTFLKDYEGAMNLIEQGIINNESLMTLLREDPLLEPLHNFERFNDSMKKVYVLSDNAIPQEKEKSASILMDSEVLQYKKKLDQLITADRLFLNPSLSLRLLAKHLHLHANKLSLLLNDHYGKNFNEYINTFRLVEFKKKAVNPANSHLTLLGLAFESGFNSKTVFNTFFKKSTGISPRVWLKSQKGQS